MPNSVSDFNLISLVFKVAFYFNAAYHLFPVIFLVVYWVSWPCLLFYNWVFRMDTQWPWLEGLEEHLPFTEIFDKISNINQDFDGVMEMKGLLRGERLELMERFNDSRYIHQPQLLPGQRFYFPDDPRRNGENNWRARRLIS